MPNSRWQSKHWKTLESNYRRAPYFDEIAAVFEPLYLQHQYTHLSALNRVLIETVCAYLGVTTKLSNSWDYQLVEGRTERLVDLCTQAGGTEYISGPSAKNYIETSLFTEQGIKLTWFEYSGYPEYPQLWSEFTHGVSILDVLFNCGKEAHHFMKYVGKAAL